MLRKYVNRLTKAFYCETLIMPSETCSMYMRTFTMSKGDLKCIGNLWTCLGSMLSCIESILTCSMSLFSSPEILLPWLGNISVCTGRLGDVHDHVLEACNMSWEHVNMYWEPVTMSWDTITMCSKPLSVSWRRLSCIGGLLSCLGSLLTVSETC
jgi:hypothetical protein